MTLENPKPRGRPFKFGNSGRPPGAKNKTTRMIEPLTEDQREQLVQKAFELAMGGNTRCIGFLLDRSWPAPKSPPITLEIGPVKACEDLLAVVLAVWTAINEGRLSPEQVVALSMLIERSMHAIELQDIAKRLRELEKDRDRHHALEHPATP